MGRDKEPTSNESHASTSVEGDGGSQSAQVENLAEPKSVDSRVNLDFHIDLGPGSSMELGWQEIRTSRVIRMMAVGETPSPPTPAKPPKGEPKK